MFFLKKILKLGGGAAAKKFQDSEKPFLDHLEDLRVTLMKVVGTLVISTLLAFVFYKQLIGIINFPVEQAGYDSRLLVLSPFEGFMSVLKICLYAGLLCSFPLILFFVGEFVIPGLNDKEKKLILPVLAFSFFLFATGVLFSYFVVIPRALAFFQEFNAGVDISTELRFKYTVSFVTMLCLVFGLCFELPVVVMSLVKLDLLNSKMMRSTRSYAIVGMFILAAVITPTPDIFTMSLLAGPMVLLYEMCIWLAWFSERKAAKREAKEREKERQELIERRKKAKLRAAAKDADKAPDAKDADSAAPEGVIGVGGDKPPAPKGPVGTLPYDPSNEAVFEDETAGDDASDSDSSTEAENRDGDTAAGTTEDLYHSGLEDDTTPEIDPTSDAVWDRTQRADTSSPTQEEHDPHTQDEYQDPDHYDHGYYDGDYFSGSIEELKSRLSDELRVDLKESIKAEIKAELLAELKAELAKDDEDSGADEKAE